MNKHSVWKTEEHWYVTEQRNCIQLIYAALFTCMRGLWKIFQLRHLALSCPLDLKVSKKASRNVAFDSVFTKLVVSTSHGKANSLCFQFSASTHPMPSTTASFVPRAQRSSSEYPSYFVTQCFSQLRDQRFPLSPSCPWSGFTLTGSKKCYAAKLHLIIKKFQF